MGVTKHGRNWLLNYMRDGKQIWENSHTPSKRLALKLLAVRKAEIAQGRFNLVSSRPPYFHEYADKFLETIAWAPTKRVYTSCAKALKSFYGPTVRLSHISAASIERYKQKRFGKKTGPATINRDLAVLRRMLNLAVRQRLIGQNPMLEVDFFDERKTRRQPHILTFEEQQRLLSVCSPRLRALVVLLTETGLRINREALGLKWEDVDFTNDCIYVRASKTAAGQRFVPLSEFCRSELSAWKNLAGPGLSELVFPTFTSTRHKLQGAGRKSWVAALTRAGISYFPIYNLRHTFASRLNAAGASPITVAQMLGHSSSSILGTYAKAIDDYRRAAIVKLEEYRLSSMARLSQSMENARREVF